MRSSQGDARADAARLDVELGRIAAGLPRMDFGDPEGLRRQCRQLVEAAHTATAGDADRLTETAQRVPGLPGEPDVAVTVLTPVGLRAPHPAIVWFHGGGFIVGGLDIDLPVSRRLAEMAQAVVVHVDYRLAPENPFPAAVRDGYAALSWAAGNADDLEVDADRIAIGGSSAGGGIAVGVALTARDEGRPSLSFQFLTYPVLDDRLTTYSACNFHDAPMFDSTMAADMWRHYLGAGAGTADVSPIAAPARETDLSGLAPTYLMTADFDPLRDEGMEFARRLIAAGVPVEYHHYPGTYHGFANLDSRLSSRAREEHGEVLRSALHGD